MKYSMIIFFIISIISIGCGNKKQNKESKESEKKEFISEVEKAHNASKYYQQKGVKFNFKLTKSSGKEKIHGNFYMKPDMSKIKFISENSNTTIIWKDQMAFIHPDTSSFNNPRFHILTWPYFFAAPFKLNDPGANIKTLNKMTLQNDTFNAAKLFFDKNTGDAPDDWYIIYKKPKKTSLIKAMAYIVTYYTSKEKAENNVHCITYENYKKVKDIPLPMQWKFWRWDKKEGLGENLMEARLSNIKFIKPEKNTFKVPKASKKVPLN